MKFGHTGIIIGGVEIFAYYGIIITFGAIMAAVLASREARRRGFNTDLVWDGLIWLLIGGIIGARLWHVFTPTPSLVQEGKTTLFYLTHPLDLIWTRQGGLGIPGAVIGGGLALFLFTRRHKLNFGVWADFAAPALAPVLLNLSIIACALFLSGMLEEPILSLAIGVILGGATQLLFQIPFLRRTGIVFRFILNLSHPGVRRIGILMAPSVLGLAVTQLNVLVSTFLASYLPEGSVSYLYYADRLLEFPMGIFAIAIATAALPALSESSSKNDIQGLKETLSFALRLVFFVTLPAMVGLVVLRVPILNLLFQRGAFNAHSTLMTAQALFYYALGLTAFAGVRIIVPAFYALQDTKTPVKVAFVALLANAGLGSVLMVPLRHGGLAFATSLAAGLNFALLAILLKRKLGRLGAAKIIRSFLRSMGASGLMGVVVYAISSGGAWDASGVTVEKISLLIGAILVGILVYAIASYLLGSEELPSVLEMVKKRIGGRNV